MSAMYKCLLAGVMISGVVGEVASATVLIDSTTNNGSFESLGGVSPATAKATHWDTDPDGDVDNWTLWGASTGGPAVNLNDSGAEVSAAATNGTRTAFLQGANAAYNLTSSIIQAGDVYSYSWDWVRTGRGPAVAQLAFLDGANIVAIAGTNSSAPGGGAPVLGITGSYTVLAGDPAIGKPIAMTIATPAGSNYPEVDNFVLNVTVVPEPTSLAAVGLMSLLLKRRRNG